MTAVVLAVPASSASAAVKPNALGPGWTAVTLRAYSGGGCAQPSAAGNLSPIINEPCNDGSVYIWYWRTVDGGAAQEFVNYTGSEALGFSGGEFKLETPNINTTILFPTYGQGTVYADYANSTDEYYMVPSAKGKPLGITDAVGFNINDSWDPLPY